MLNQYTHLDDLATSARLYTLTYDGDGRLANIDYQSYGGTAYPLTAFSTAYGYDAVGNRKFMRHSGLAPEDRSEHYDYDGRHRLKQVDRGTLSTSGDQVTTQLQQSVLAGKQEWSNLDRRGNWSEYKETVNSGLTTQTRSANDVNQYTSIDPDGPASGSPCTSGCAYAVMPSYDAAGNLTTDPLAKSTGDTSPAGQWYKYDEENRLVRIRRSDDNAILLEFAYDALGRRVETAEYFNPQTGAVINPARRTRHVFDGIQTIQEYCVVGQNCPRRVREFIWGDAERFPEPVAMIDYTGAGLDGDAGTGSGFGYHYLRDVLGSVIGLTNVSGNPVERYTYDPYGKTLIEKWNTGTSAWQQANASAFGNPFLWTGQRYDAATGTYHFLFRTYFNGRWLQRDPLGYVDGVNLYQYTMSDPIGWLDPWGLDPLGGSYNCKGEFVPDNCHAAAQKALSNCLRAAKAGGCGAPTNDDCFTTFDQSMDACRRGKPGTHNLSIAYCSQDLLGCLGSCLADHNAGAISLSLALGTTIPIGIGQVPSSGRGPLTGEIAGGRDARYLSKVGGWLGEKIGGRIGGSITSASKTLARGGVRASAAAGVIVGGGVALGYEAYCLYLCTTVQGG